MVVVVASAVLVIGLTWLLLWPGLSVDPMLKLKVLRQTVDQGKPVVFFRVEGGTNRRIAISRVARIIVENSNSWTLSLAHELDTFQGLVPPGPIEVPSMARQGFGVFVPTNAATWKLFVEVDKDDLSPPDRFREMPAIWKGWRKHGCSLYEATKVTWHSFFTTSLEFIESELFTNSIPSSR